MISRIIVPFFISHQGCPHRCVFCDQKRISGGGERLPDGREIVATISSYRGAAGNVPAEVAFYGGSFTSLPAAEQERLLLPLQPLLASGEVTAIRISTRPDTVDRGIARFLAAMGVRTVELGVQSMDDGILEMAGRGHKAIHTEVACRALRGEGLTVGMQLMPGLPGDTKERILASLERVLALSPDFIRIYPALVIAGTGLAELYLRGDYSPLGLREAIGISKIMLHRALRAGVDVIRIGLQASAAMESEAVLAGPYHPAFRQLVEAELCYDLMAKLCAAAGGASPVTVYCAPSRLSDVIGQKRGNMERLAREEGVEVTAVREESSLSRLELEMDWGCGRVRGEMVADLQYGGGRRE